MPTSPELSIIVPALNERENLGALIDEVKRAVIDAGIDAELIIVDDGSTDGSAELLGSMTKQLTWLHPLRRERSQGQSAAMAAGIAAARGAFVATLDADLQNDPADLPAMLEIARRNEADLVQGDRARRQDSLSKRLSSAAGRAARRFMLRDGVRDTGCTTRVLTAALAKQLPLQFRGMHRFIPVYCRMLGARVKEVVVNHRPRRAGKSHYGVLNRAFATVRDLIAVRWMLSRHRDPSVQRVRSDADEA